MGLDPGEKRVGVAISDDLGLTATGVAVVPAGDRQALLGELGRLAAEYKVERVVMGVPRRMDGALGPEAERYLELARELEAFLGIQVAAWDERMSTQAVERVLIEADMSRAKRKKVRDKVAAVYILQGYLDAMNGGVFG